MRSEIKVFRKYHKDYLGKVDGAKVKAEIQLQMEPRIVRQVRDLLTDHAKFKLNQAAGLFEIRYSSKDADAVHGDLKRLYTAVNIFSRTYGCRVEYVDAGGC
jgi:hypothetical protein